MAVNIESHELAPGDEPMSNQSNNEHFADVVARRMSRRQVLAGGLGAAVTTMFAGAALNEAVAQALNYYPTPAAPSPSLGFAAIPVTRSDTTTVPFGYRVQPLIPWGQPITGSYPRYRGDGTNGGADQEQQVGSHHDGIHYFPLPDDPNGHGLLAVNHEYVDANVLHAAGPALVGGRRPADQVRKEIAAHGVSVVEIRRVGRTWGVVRSPYNRRITGATPMAITGPVRGSDFVRTKYSPDGTLTRGTLNNCGNGYTPWNTYLTCEENWAGYFVNRGVRPREQTRFGVPSTNGRYRWETARVDSTDAVPEEYARFDLTPTAATATDDYRNEVNGQGWIVEIDPFEPNSVPKKRTALGRFGHEGCWPVPPKDGERMTFYMGDDAQNEYVYKFVTNATWSPSLPRVNDVLDSGTLYVARFDDDGTGTWLPLDFADAGFQARALAAGVTFASQADVLVNTRLAADVSGATRMDRPEWGAVHPVTREGYMTMTNSGARTAAQVDAANPRGPNPFGHIIRWRETNDDPAATTFAWDIFVLSGTVTDSQVLPGQGGPKLDATNIHASPDGLWFDYRGVLWIQTDMSGSQQSAGPFGENSMLAANPVTGEIKRFLAGPFDQEVTGMASTPDGRTLFVNFQHPGDRSTPGNFTSNWPDNGAWYRHPGDAPVLPRANGPRPRSATIVITRDDGGVVGA